MDPMQLEASARAETGKKISSALRREGAIPAVVYGEGHTPAAIALTAKDLARALHTAAGENVLITLTVKQADGTAQPARTVLIKEIQHHPVTAQVLHVDFHQVSLTKRIQVTVPLQFTGEAIGVKQDGGRLDHLLWEVRVECLPTEIPKRLDVDVSALKIGDSLLIKDLVVPAGIKLLHEPQVGVAAVQDGVGGAEEGAVVSEVGHGGSIAVLPWPRANPRYGEGQTCATRRRALGGPARALPSPP